MSQLIIDASVAAKWFFPEIYGEYAFKIFKKIKTVVVPDLFYAEMGSIIWKRVQKGFITQGEAMQLAYGLDTIPLLFDSRPSSGLLSAALKIACDTEASVYDSLYIALALDEELPCITADEKLYKRIQTTSLAHTLVWIGDFK